MQTTNYWTDIYPKFLILTISFHASTIFRIGHRMYDYHILNSIQISMAAACPSI